MLDNAGGQADIIVKQLGHITEQQEKIMHALAGVDARQSKIEDTITDVDLRLSRELRVFTQDAFPGGDVDGHRRYHQQLIASGEQRLKLRQAIIEKTLTSLVWAAMVGLAFAVWEWAKAHIKT